MDLLGSAIELTIVGMGVVFLSLLALMYVIQILNRASAGWNREKHWPETKAEAGPEEEAGGLSLVLAAAAGHFLETERADVFIPDVSHNPESRWVLRARAGGAVPRRPR